MALSLRLDLEKATIADLEALLAAARSGGADGGSEVSLDGTQLVIDADTAGAPRPAQPATAREPESPASKSDSFRDAVAPVGDAAIRTVIDILSGRQNPQGR
ncbi:hypothetical protein [Corynebacterium phocae]|uniref:hypothetical protein n=1 Tax=Corynebacterium phocae TaxID=161895 RepID=UPI001B802313|nr:hypothetical protein [Corynebacterium phocae]